MDTAGRLLRLLGLFQARPTWAAEELARRLETTDRTVRRDVTRLRALGYPVDSFSGPGGGYQFGSTSTVPPLVLDDDEAVAVAVALRATASSTAESGLEESSLVALAKLEGVLPPRLRRRLEDLTVALVQLTRGAPPPADPTTLATLAQACRRQERVRFEYRTSDGRTGQRHVEPYRIVATHRRWYLVAHDRDRDAWRTFRVDRITDPVPTGIPFERAESPDAAEMVSNAIAVSPYALQARVLLYTDPAHASTLIAPTTGRVEDNEDGTSTLMIGADELDWIASYICGLAVRVQVLEPPELIDMVREFGARLVADHAPVRSDQGVLPTGQVGENPA